MATPPVAPGFQNQQFGEVERIERMPAPPQPMQPRPSLVVGGPAFFTPEGYQAPVQPEQAFMPTDRRTDAIGDNFKRPYERPIMPMPSPTPPPEMAQPAPPRVPIEQPIKEPVTDPGPITTQPVMPMPEPTPQPKYNPFAYSDLGRRALGGEYINSMTFHYFDPTTGKSGSTTEGYSRVPDSAKPYIYLNKDEANKARDNFLEYEDRGDIDTTPKRTPVTAPAPAPTPNDLGEPLPPGTDNGIDMSEFLGSREETLKTLQAMFGPQAQYATPTTATNDSGGLRGLFGNSFIPQVSKPPEPIATQPMPSMPSLPSRLTGLNIPVPKLPTLGSRPSLTRSPMRGNPRER